MKTSEKILLIIVFAFFILAIFAYNYMPEKMATHWNIKGEADNFSSRFWGVSIIPITGLILFIIFLILPRIDPLKNNVKKFRKYFDFFVAGILLFLFYIYTLSLLWNIGWQINITMAIIPALALLWYSTGVLLSGAERNWFIGIRNPWTLSDDRVWAKTHALGGKLAKASAVIALVSVFTGPLAFFLSIIPMLASMVFLMFYSYFTYQKLNHKPK